MLFYVVVNPEEKPFKLTEVWVTCIDLIKV